MLRYTYRAHHPCASPRRTLILSGVIILRYSKGTVKATRSPRDICHRNSALAPTARTGFLPRPAHPSRFPRDRWHCQQHARSWLCRNG